MLLSNSEFLQSSDKKLSRACNLIKKLVEEQLDYSNSSRFIPVLQAVIGSNDRVNEDFARHATRTLFTAVSNKLEMFPERYQFQVLAVKVTSMFFSQYWADNDMGHISKTSQ